jgi:hypothetical protein
MWTVVPNIYNVFTARHIQASIFNYTDLRCYWRYIDNSMIVILQTWCQIQRTSSSLRYLNCGPGHMQCDYSSSFSAFNIQLRVFALILEMCQQFSEPYTANVVPNTAHILQFTECGLWPGHTHYNYRSTYSGFNIQQNVAPLILKICRQFTAWYTTNLVPI